MNARLGLLAAGVVFVGSFGAANPGDPAPPDQPIYHSDPQHLWNRLHEALLVRIGPDKQAYGRDRLEPLLWTESRHLLEDRSRDQAVAVLEEFVKDRGETLIDDPLKRAVLQRDLWLVFNWLEGDRGNSEARPRPEALSRLRRALAAVIGRLVLSPDQIERLPDNYAAAVASGEFAKRFDPAQPDRPYLPPDLFAADGPWVCVGRPNGPVAPTHLREDGDNRFTNSVFLVFLRLPAGRAATLDYLKQLRAFDQPLLVPRVGGGSADKFLPNPKLPPLPVGTEVALVRRALLVAATRAPVASALTESVQLRVYREVPEMTARTLDISLGGGAEARPARAWQSSFEFRLSRARLFDGRSGGLHAVGPDERDFKTGFGAHPWDEFERPADPARNFAATSQRFAIRELCFACHGFPGVYSFNSYYNFRLSNTRDGDTRRPAALAEVTVAQAHAAAVTWKQGRPNWAALRGLLKE